MREIAVLFALEDVEFNLKASGELSIGGLHVLTKVFGLSRLTGDFFERTILWPVHGRSGPAA